jgi:hypothetical protein
MYKAQETPSISGPRQGDQLHPTEYFGLFGAWQFLPKKMIWKV